MSFINETSIESIFGNEEIDVGTWLNSVMSETDYMLTSNQEIMKTFNENESYSYISKFDSNQMKYQTGQDFFTPGKFQSNMQGIQQ